MDISEYMDVAYKEAEQALKENETPIGAVLVYQGEIIAKAHNLSLKDTDPTEHAEMLVLKEGFKKLKTKNLSECQIYITLEPCLMCLGALINSHVKDIFFGALDPKKGAFTHYEVSSSIDGIEIHYLKDERCGQIVSVFFKKVRAKTDKKGC
jgi:tRNA(adenine34) deaminase